MYTLVGDLTHSLYAHGFLLLDGYTYDVFALMWGLCFIFVRGNQNTKKAIDLYEAKRHILTNMRGPVEA